ncbi:hypothetical protein [Pelagibius sp. Alg239-R121]|uniref:hypothetical protein n=1 Tax=Pelagibius sp. Alg239-R121 TaxID=2993448 RepID=UPI0024A78C54|nr:hypothetical protein [Pelagibius sp. Alg239-R121]
MRTILLPCLSALLLTGCTLAGDALDPYEEKRADCKIEDATPIPQTGLVPVKPAAAERTANRFQDLTPPPEE